MADSNNPFGFSPFAAFQKMMGDAKMPGFDMASLVEAQNRTAQAFAEMGRKNMETMQGIVQRQSEMMRENMKEASSYFNHLLSAPSAEEKFACHNEYTKAAMERAVANNRELTELVTKSSNEAAEMMSSSITDIMSETRKTGTRG